jgi:uncharacterized membrane protein
MKPALKIPFILSVSLNCLLLGLLSANCVKGKGPEKGTMILDLAKQAKISPEASAQVVSRTNTAVAEWEKLTSEIESERLKALGILRKEPFDAEAYTAGVHHITGLRTERREKMSVFVTWLAAQISPADRAKLAALLERP